MFTSRAYLLQHIHVLTGQIMTVLIISDYFSCCSTHTGLQFSDDHSPLIMITLMITDDDDDDSITNDQCKL